MSPICTNEKPSHVFKRKSETDSVKQFGSVYPHRMPSLWRGKKKKSSDGMLKHGLESTEHYSLKICHDGLEDPV